MVCVGRPRRRKKVGWLWRGWAEMVMSLAHRGVMTVEMEAVEHEAEVKEELEERVLGGARQRARLSCTRRKERS